jgi:hypothetical protein
MLSQTARTQTRDWEIFFIKIYCLYPNKKPPPMGGKNGLQLGEKLHRQALLCQGGKLGNDAGKVL